MDQLGIAKAPLSTGELGSMVRDTTDFNGACNQHGPSYDNRIQEQLQCRLLVSSKGKQGRQAHGSTVAINDDWNCPNHQGAVRRCVMYSV